MKAKKNQNASYQSLRFLIASKSNSEFILSHTPFFFLAPLASWRSPWTSDQPASTPHMLGLQAYIIRINPTALSILGKHPISELHLHPFIYFLIYPNAMGLDFSWVQGFQDGAEAKCSYNGLQQFVTVWHQRSPSPAGSLHHLSCRLQAGVNSVPHKQ